MSKLVIFIALVAIALMFIITKHPEYNPLNNQKQEVNSTGDVLKDAIKASDKHQGEN
ncbi:MAG: hypothetical protein KAU90_03800 [Sulfurovaceae bacterium]|nr:hypothetical protein [Sulfurovaceae bacterium]